MTSNDPNEIYTRIERAALKEVELAAGSMDVIRATMALAVNMSLAAAGRDRTIRELEALIATLRVGRAGSKVGLATLENVEPKGRA